MKFDASSANDILKRQITKTQEQLKQAEQNLNYAEDPEFIRVAVYEIYALRAKLDALYKKAKKKEV
jgi:DNA-binding transcriptional regulator GbsR (MarR family)